MLLDIRFFQCYSNYLKFNHLTIRKGLIEVPKVEIREGESFESAMRKFKTQIEQEGILKEVRDRKHYQTPSERKRTKMQRR